MDRYTCAEVRFSDDESAASGILVRIDSQCATLRLTEPGAEKLFAFGRAGTLIYPAESGLYSVACRLVAEFASDLNRDLFLVLTGVPQAAERRQHERTPCRLEAVYRTAHDRQAYGAWSPATVVDLGPEGMALRVGGRPDFPPLVEVQIMLPEEFCRGQEDPASRGVTIVRHGSPVVPETSRPIRLRAELRHCRNDGTSSSYGLKFVAVPASVADRLAALLDFLRAAEASRPFDSPQSEPEQVRLPASSVGPALQARGPAARMPAARQTNRITDSLQTRGGLRPAVAWTEFTSKSSWWQPNG